MNIVNICTSCTEAMPDEISDWVRTNSLVLQRKLLEIDTYKFGSAHMFRNLACNKDEFF